MEPAGVNTIEYVTIATLGNTQDFGDVSNTNNGVLLDILCKFHKGNPWRNVSEYTRIESIQINSFGTGVILWRFK